MPPLYIVQQNTKIRIRNRRLQVELEEDGSIEVVLSAPLAQVSQVVLFGNISLTTPAIDALLAQESEVIFLSQRGDYRGRLVGRVTPHVPIRRAQYKSLDDDHFMLEIAKGFVSAKLKHQRALLLRHNQEQKDAEIEAACQQISQALENVSHKTAISSLRGLEGSATAAYFGGYKRLFDPVWNFEKRNRRPPADPVNVLLSFGYTLLAELVSSAVQTVGLDPYVGFLHEYVYNRPGLALDLMEEFRPVVDGVVLYCCRGGILTPQDFDDGPSDFPVILQDAGKKRFIQTYEKRMDQTYLHPLRGLKLPMRQCIIEQARQIADCVQSTQPVWRGMGFR
ncbi:MAG: CRISPR-associated endonuclease Cas1 [Chloroflexota bacterium]